MSRLKIWNAPSANKMPNLIGPFELVDVAILRYQISMYEIIGQIWQSLQIILYLQNISR